MNIRTIFGKLLKIDNSPWANERVVFVLNKGTFTTDATYLPDRKITTTDSEGNFSIDLWTNAEGAIASAYKCILPSLEEFDFTIPVGGPVSIEFLRSVSEQPSPPPNSLLQFIEEYVDDSIEGIQTDLDGKISSSEKGQPNGVASLQANGTLFDNQIPATITRDSELTAGLATKADSNHIHTIADVSGLDAALDAKVDSSDLTTALATKADAVTITGLQTALDGKANLTGATFTGAVQVPSAVVSTSTGITLWHGGDSATPVVLTSYNATGSERGLSVPQLRCTNGRIDINPLASAAEFRITGASTQVRFWNSTNANSYLTLNNDRSVNFFNTLNSAGRIVVADTTSSTSKITGSALFAGGVGVAGSIFANALVVSPASNGTIQTWQNTGGSTAASVDSFGNFIAAGIVQGGAFQTSGNLSVSSTTASTSTTTGSATFAGGVGIAGSLNLGTALSVSNGGTGATTVAAARTALGIILAFDYIQQSVPSSPTDRQRWLEIDASGTPVNKWFWDAANSRWLAIDPIITGLATTLTATTTTRIPSQIISGGGGYLVEGLEIIVGTATAHDSTNYFNMELRTRNASGVTTNITGASANTQTLSGATITRYAPTFTSQTVSTLGSVGLVLQCTKFVSAPNTDIDVKVTLRKIR